jgi:hypothetical protein
MSQLRKTNVTPVFEANLNAYKAGYPVICNEGGSRCFADGTLVYTNDGLTNIKDIKAGDLVLTQNEGCKKVLDVYVNKNTKRCIKLKLKDGKEIIATEDHKFMFRQRWHELKNIVSLWNENDTKL